MIDDAYSVLGLHLSDQTVSAPATTFGGDLWSTTQPAPPGTLTPADESWVTINAYA